MQSVRTCEYASMWVTIGLLGLTSSGCFSSAGSTTGPSAKRTIGATANVVVEGTDLILDARVDTGAQTTSIDAEQVEIADEAPSPEDNLGKTVRFLVTPHTGEPTWVEATISGQTVVMTANDQSHPRYEVLLNLRVKDHAKQVAVTLNDRSRLDHPMLIGRNFLIDDYVVDVSLDRDD